MKIEVITVLKEVQRKLSDKGTNNRMDSLETQVLIQENGFRLENLQGRLRNVKHILSYMRKVRETTRSVRGLLVFQNKKLY